MIWLYIILFTIIFIVAVIIFCIAPGRLSQEARKTAKTFHGLNCAHRGLYSEDQTLPENSCAAFAAARREGYGVELDVQLSKDNKVVVFHDNDLNRACGIDAPLRSMEWKELSKTTLFGTDECIPLLSDVLELLDDSPVIVELKSTGSDIKILCNEVHIILQNIGFNYCIESFDPRIIKWFRKNAPHILRGQLSNPPEMMNGVSKISAFVLGKLLLNFISRPHFIAYSNTRLPFFVKLCKALKPINVIWTLKPGDDIEKCEKENATIIFEHYKPQPIYRKSSDRPC